MPAVYSKPHLPVGDQVALLGARGLEITDVARAEAALTRIGYYRLSEYWHPMREAVTVRNAHGADITVVQDNFRPGARFSDALDLYVFDKRLRLLILDAIERVEVGLRVHCAHTLGARDPHLHRDWRALDPSFIAKDHARWLSRIDDAAARSREDFISRFLKDYDPPLPLWVSIECWDFGMLSYFISGLRTPDKTAMATHYGLPRRDLLTSWVRSINNVRNICAHHGRLWNAVLVDRTAPPKVGVITDLDHLARHQKAHNRIYAAAVALAWFMRTLNPDSRWAGRLASHLGTFPVSPLLSLQSSGFPEGWETLDFWRAAIER